MSTATLLQQMYDRLLSHFGPQNWWPADSPFEVVVGAVLTQNTNWSNVSLAIERLRQRGVLTCESLMTVPENEIAELIRPSGYYNLKARRLRNLLGMLAKRYEGNLDNLLSEEADVAREALLQVKGVGEETADSILLYAGNHRVFVVDAYTYRICHRHQLIGDECDYRSLQELFMDNLPADLQMYNEYHALLVATGKHYCKKNNPRCSVCPLEGL